MGEGMGPGQQGAFASSVNLPEPEKTVSTLAAAAFLHPTSASEGTFTVVPFCINTQSEE